MLCGQPRVDSFLFTCVRLGELRKATGWDDRGGRAVLGQDRSRWVAVTRLRMLT